MDDRLPEVPRPDRSDLVRKGIVGIMSAIPFAAPIVDMVLPSTFENRLITWLMKLKEDFEKLEKKVDELDPKALAEDEEFMTTVLNAARIVSFTHRKEKHEMLRNVVLNSALPDAPEDDERTVFLNLVEEFSVSHILVLKAFRLPGIRDLLGFSLEVGEWRENAGVGELFDFVTNSTPELDIKFDFFVLVLSGLHARQLIGNSHQEVRRTLTRISHTPELTAFGQRFLKFIESPLDD